MYKILYTGNADGQCSVRKLHIIEGSSGHAIFSCSGEKRFPGKHLSLGLTVKSLIGSKTMVSLLNRFGHCASDETTTQIDLGLEKTFFKTKTLVPSHITRKSNVSTGRAWDNCDINIEAPSGANTEHHTYGICYQNTLPQEQIQNFENSTTNIEDSLIPSKKEKFVASRKHTPQKTLSV